MKWYNLKQVLPKLKSQRNSKPAGSLVNRITLFLNGTRVSDIDSETLHDCEVTSITYRCNSIMVLNIFLERK